MQQRSSPALLAEFLNGNEQAFKELYNRWHKETRQLIARRTHSHPSDIDDVHQFFWYQLIKYAGTYNPEYPFRSWILRCVFKASARYYKPAKKRGDGQRIRSLDAEPVHPPSQESNPVEAAVQEERKGAVREALGRLPEPLRELFQRLYYHGESVYDYARRENLPVGTVKSRLNRALKLMRQELG